MIAVLTARVTPYLLKINQLTHKWPLITRLEILSLQMQSIPRNLLQCY